VEEEWIKDVEGRNMKFRREALLNYAMNRWGLNKAASVGPTSELIRRCGPRSYEDWEEFYFREARQKKRDGLSITREFLTDLGRRLYVKLSEVVHSELAEIQEEECIEYVFNLVLNRTYEGYRTEVETIYGQLQDALEVRILPAPDEWDRSYCVDFHIEVREKHVGLQIKPISSGIALDQYQWDTMHAESHQRFTRDFGGRVFFVYSVKEGTKKRIANADVIDEIRAEITCLREDTCSGGG